MNQTLSEIYGIVVYICTFSIYNQVLITCKEMLPKILIVGGDCEEDCSVLNSEKQCSFCRLLEDITNATTFWFIITFHTYLVKICLMTYESRVSFLDKNCLQKYRISYEPLSHC